MSREWKLAWGRVGFLAALAVATIGAPREAAAQAALQVEAQCLAGEPLGVGYLSLPLGRGQPLPQMREANGRTLYVASLKKRKGLLRNRGEFGRYWFLFRGDQPLELQFHATGGDGNADPNPVSLVVQPQRGSSRQLTLQWWELFQQQAKRRIDADCPPIVDQYLLAMLARRMQLPLEIKRRQRREEDRPLATLELLAGGERLRGQMLRESMLQPSVEIAPQPAPEGAIWAEPPEQPVAENVVIERLATHVPPECFYIRFGKFSNFLWLTHLIREQGGDLNGMIASRGIARDMNERFERQFAIRYSVLADLLGDQVVSDLALIGFDLYLDDGASMGVLLEARNSLLLDTALSRERSAAMSQKAKRQLRRTKVKIGEHEVDLIVSPDNSVRSFLAASGDARLVSNSRALVERFLAVHDGARPLAATNEFRHARTLLPVDREDTLFAYFSTHFFHNLVSPRYQIELLRRLQVVNDFQLIELARLAAAREGLPTDEPSMAAAGLLPRDWVRRADGSRLLASPNGGWVDSLRGARGTLLPIADIKLSKVSEAERLEYSQLAAYYQDKWLTMDPLVAAVKRHSVQGQSRRERLVIDAHVSPFIDRKYGPWLSLLGPSTTDRVAAPKDAVIRAQASVRGGRWRPDVEAHQIALGILDRHPEIDDLQVTGLLDGLRTIQAIPGYLATWPRPGLLDFLPFGAGEQQEVNGISRLPFRLWRYRRDDYSALAFNRPLLEDVSPTITVERAEAPAQIWAQIDDLTQTQLAPWIRQLNFQQAVRVTRGNALMLNTLTHQLGAGEDVKQIAARLVDGQLQCPLEGGYRRQQQIWQPTAGLEQVPEDYQSPLLTWFRGAAVMLNGAGSGRLTLHAEIDLQRAERESLLQLPLLSGLPKLFGSMKIPEKGEESGKNGQPSSEPKKGGT